MTNSLLNITDSWIGFYTCEVGYPYELRSKPVKFSLSWMVQNGIVKGECIDEGTERLLSGPALIEGFIEGDFVSFIKRYPFCWGYDESYNLVIMKDFPSPEIHYSGNYFEKRFEGIWEMEINQKDINGQSFEKYYSGTWLMKMKK